MFRYFWVDGVFVLIDGICYRPMVVATRFEDFVQIDPLCPIQFCSK